MTPRVLSIAWTLLGVLALGLWLGLVATDRSRSELLRVVIGADAVRPTAQECHAADDLLTLELAAVTPDPVVVASAWAVLSVAGVAEPARVRITRRVEQLFMDEAARQRPNDDRLRLAHELAAVVDTESAAELHARITSLAGNRRAEAAALAVAADAVQTADSGPALAAAVAGLRTAWQQLVDAGLGSHHFTWAARETPPVSDAIANATAVLRVALQTQLADPAVEPDDARATWKALEALDGVDGCDPSLIARYAAVTRRDAVSGQGLLLAVIVALLLFGGAALAYRRVVRGIRPIDPGAETMEGVDAIDLDTDAVTVQRNTTDEQTRVDV